MLTPDDIQAVQSSFKQAASDASALTRDFYKRLFELSPELRGLFPQELTTQGEKLATMLSTIVGGLNQIEVLIPAAQDLAIRHISYGVHVEHYDIVGQALVDTLAQHLGPQFDKGTRAAWVKTYTLLADVMKKAAYPF